MGVFDFFYIAAEKIKSAFIKVKDALTSFFSKALNMMKDVIDKLARKLNKPIKGVVHFVQKIGDKWQEKTKNYTLDEEIGEWNEITVTKSLVLEDVPPEYQTMDDEFEVNDTQQIDAELVC